jgi:hypothetical protein
MHRTLRATLLAMFVSAIALSSTGRARVIAEKEMLSGHWHLVFYGKCVMSRANLAACRSLQGPATFAAMNVPGSTLEVKGIGDYVSDKTGKYSVTFKTWVTERVAGAAHPAQCNNTTVFFGAFTGTCLEIGTGYGHIAKGITGMSDFWQDETTGYWKGTPPAHFATGGPTDTFNPTCPEVYSAKKFLALFGFKSVPTGITAHIVLKHRP